MTLDIFDINTNKLIFHFREKEEDTKMLDGIHDVIEELLEELQKRM